MASRGSLVGKRFRGCDLESGPDHWSYSCSSVRFQPDALATRHAHAYNFAIVALSWPAALHLQGMQPHRSVEGSARDRQIVAARVILTCPGRNFVTLKIETRSGVHGLGDATLNGRELAVAAYLQEHIAPNLIGRDAGRI